MPPPTGTRTVTNIDGFEASWSVDAFDLMWLNNGLRDSKDDSRLACVNTSAIKRTGDRSLLAWTNGYCCVPLDFDVTGLPLYLPITFKAVIVRCYITLYAVNPDATKQVMGMGKDPFPFVFPPTPTIRVEVDTARQLSLDGNKAGSPTTLTLNTQYLVEWVYDSVNSTTELWIDDALEVQLSQSLGSVDYLMLGDERSGGFTYRTYDDLLIQAHRTNPAVVTRVGEGRVLRLDPNATGTDDDWSPNLGSDNYLVVDDFLGTDGDGTYSDNGGAAGNLTVGVEAFSGHSGPPSVGSDAEPRAVKVNSVIRAASGTPNWRGVRLRSGSAVDETSPINNSVTSYNCFYTKVYQNDPDTGVAWTRSGVDAVEPGIGIDDTDTGRVSAIQCQVEYSTTGAVFQPKAVLVNIMP